MFVSVLSMSFTQRTLTGVSCPSYSKRATVTRVLQIDAEPDAPELRNSDLSRSKTRLQVGVMTGYFRYNGSSLTKNLRTRRTDGEDIINLEVLIHQILCVGTQAHPSRFSMEFAVLPRFDDDDFSSK
jgi:hypothetical protein